ncbi:MAG TPA: glycosyltransferase [Elusimicrobiales bacterium]|nr:glycosyltransferase [Elusimicrobiales bacterium]
MRPPLLVVSSSYSKDSFVRHLALRCAEDFSVTVLIPDGCESLPADGKLDERCHQQFPFGLTGLAYGAGIVSNMRRKKFLLLGLPLYFLYLVSAIRATINKTGAKVLHAHWLVPGALAAVVCKRLFNKRIKILATAHGSDLFLLPQTPAKPLVKFALSGIDCLAVVSSPLAQAARELGYRGRIEICSMGVDTALFSAPQKPARTPTVVFAARLVHRKGAHILLEAFSKIASKHPRTRLVLAGDGEQRGSLENLAGQLGLAERVEFKGALTQQKLADLLACADIFVNPTLANEGFGLANVEAMSCGCIPLVADYPAAHGIIQHGVNGFLFPQGNAKALSELLSKTIETSASMAQIRSAAVRTARKHFDWDSIASSYIHIFKSLR